MSIGEIVSRIKSLKDDIEVEELTTSAVVERLDDIIIEIEDETPYNFSDDSLDNFSMRDYS